MTTSGLKVAPDEKREFLRHTLATLAYRGGKVLRDVPAGFAEFRAAETTRTPGQILAHIGDLLDWALSMAKGKQEWHDSARLTWGDGTRRFFVGTQALEQFLTSGQPLGVSTESLFQGPIGDALTHVGQIAMLRRMAGYPIKGENYFKAEIVAGRVGPEQAAPKREFD
jgi:hypothetical protein